MFRRVLFLLMVALTVSASSVFAQQTQILNGLTYLSSAQGADGKWGSLNGLRDTETVAETLRTLGKTDDSYRKAIEWIGSASIESNDYIARRIISRKGAGADVSADVGALSSCQNADGGWGYYAGYASGIYDTVIVLQALKTAQYQNAAALKTGVDYLVAKQNQDGGWSLLADEPGDVSTTSIAISVLKKYQDSGTPLAAGVLDKAVAWLITKQNLDGGFGSSPSTAYESALALSALVECGKATPQALAGATFYLNTNQRPDGSWDSSPYETALALNTLAILKPDLAVTTGDVTLSKSDPVSGDIVAITAVVHNTGTATAANVPVQFIAESADGQTSVIASQLVPQIQLASSSTVTADFDTTGREGKYNLIVKVDPDNAFEELSKANNQVTTSLTITPHKPDLSIVAADVSLAPSSPKTGETVKISAVVMNTGPAQADNFKVLIIAESPTHELITLASPAVPTLAAGSSITVTADFDTKGKQGIYLIRVQLDPDGAVAEISRSNNEAHVSSPIAPVADLALAGFTASPNSLHIGDDVTLNATVTNQGNAPALNFEVAYYVNSVTDAAFLGKSIITSLAPGESSGRSFVWKSTVHGMGTMIIAVANPGGKMPEVNTANNQASVSLNIETVTDPNLAISYKDITFDPPVLKEGSPAVISGLIRNTGFAPVDTVDVAFYEGNPSQDGVLLGTATLLGIQPGATSVASLAWHKVPNAGEKMVYLKIDPGNVVTEFNKDDNDAFVMTTIMSLPDLSISNDSINVNPAYPKEGDAISIRVTVVNTGDQDAADVSVRVNEGNETAGIQSIPLVKGHSESTVAIPYVLAGKNGVHGIKVSVDPDNRIAEQKKDNNTGETSFVIQNANLWVTEQYISPNGDGVKDTTDFSFRLDAAAKVKVLVINGKGETVRTFAGGELDNTTGRTITWDGVGDSGTVVADGEYQIQVAGADNAVIGTLAVVVDTDRSPMSEAIGTRYLLQNNLTCNLPPIDLSNLQWFKDESGILLDVYPIQDKDAQYTDGIYSISPFGEDILRVVPWEWSYYNNPERYYSSFVKAISPNLEKIAVALTNCTKKPYACVDEWWVTGRDGTKLAFLNSETTSNNAHNISWSPDSGYLLASGSGLFIVDTITHVKTDIILSQRIDSFEWSPDGENIAFVYQNNGINNLEVSDKLGRRKTVFSPGNYVSKIHWLGNLFIVAETADSSDIMHVWLVDATGGGNNRDVSSTGLQSWDSAGESNTDKSKYVFLEGGLRAPGDIQRVKVIDNSGTLTTVSERTFDEGWTAYESIGVTTNMVWSADSSKLAFIDSQYNKTEDTVYESLVSYNSVNKTTSRKLVNSYKCMNGGGGGPKAAAFGVMTSSCSNSAKTTRIFAWMKDRVNLLVKSFVGLFLLDGGTGQMSPALVVDGLWADPYPADTNSVALSPNDNFVTYVKPQDSNTTCYTKNADLWSMTSLLNLTADLRVSKKMSAITLKGIASDKHFAGYSLEYADLKHPDDWNPIMPPSDIPVLNDVFTTWVPPGDGTFYVRLTVWDLAGNTAISRKRVSWGLSSSVSNLYTSLEAFSPNGDKVKDTVDLNYQVLEPVHLEFTVVNDQNQVVRTFIRDHAVAGPALITWDGRDENGIVVPDGKYVFRLFDFDFPVLVDATPPVTKFNIGPYKFIPSIPWPYVVGDNDPPPYLTVSAEMDSSVLDKNLKRWSIEYGTGDNPTDWQEYKHSDSLLFNKDAAADQTYTFGNEYQDNDIQWLMNKKFRLTAEDFTGNIARSFAQFDQELVYIKRYDGAGVMFGKAPLSGTTPGQHTLSFVHFLKYPIDKMYAQYEIGMNVWREELLDWKSGDYATINLTGRVMSVKLRVVDTGGYAHFSNVIHIGSRFKLESCEEGSQAENYLTETLVELKFQEKTGSNTWADYFVFQGSVVPVGVFGPPVPPADGTIRMVAKDDKGTIFTSNEVHYPPYCFIRIKDVVKYEEVTECGGMPTQAVISAELDADTKVPVIPKGLGVYLMKNNTWSFLGEFDLTRQKLEDVKVPIDTTQMAEREYPIKLLFRYQDLTHNVERTIENIYEGWLADPWLRVDRKLADVRFAYPAEGQMACPVRNDGPLPGGEWFSVTAKAFANDDSTTWFEAFYGEGENPLEWLPARTTMTDIKGEVIHPQIVGSGPSPDIKIWNGDIEPWDVSSLMSGTYSLKLKVHDAVGNISCKTTTFTLEKASIIQSLTSDKTLFSPNGDGVLDNVRFDYAIDRNATIDARVFKDIGSDGKPELDKTILRTVVSGKPYFVGTDSFVWDGRDDSGAVLPDGRYGLVLYATNPCGVTSIKSILLEIDNTPPVTVISYPDPLLQLTPGNIIEITGSAYDPHFAGYAVDAGEGDNPVDWIPIISSVSPVRNALLTRWNTFGLTGKWTIRLSTADKVGNRAVRRVTTDLDIRKTLIKSLEIAPDYFSPNNDLKADSTVLKYELTDACNMKMQVFDSSSNPVREYSFSAPSAGRFTWTWDGKNSSGGVAPDGSYRIKVDAALASNYLVQQTESLSVIVDSTLPVVAIKKPDKAYLNATLVTVSGEVSDKYLSAYSAKISGPDGTSVLDSGDESRKAYTFGTITDLKEDTYTITFDGKDLAENSSQATTVFTIDRTPPKATLDTPKAGEYFGNTKKVIDINGSLVEKNLARYSLRYGSGEAPTEWKEVGGGDSLPAAGRLFSLKVGKDDGIADGVYIISLYAKDKVDLEGEARARVVIDNTPPEVAITSVKEGDYRNASFDVKGTLSDANLDKGTLDISEGKCASASKWATVRTLTASVTDGVINTFAVLPADGDYCLRVSAVDKSGNTAETKVSVTIDTKPPAAPVLSGKIENRTDIRLDWTKNTEPDLAGYNLYRNNAKLNQALLQGITYLDPGLKEGTYTYTVKAVDYAGNESESSNSLKLIIDLTGPSVRIASPADGSRVSNLVDIRGTAYSADDFKQYRLSIGKGALPASWNVIRTSPVSVSYGSLSQWDTITLTEGDTYTIKLEGEDISGNISTSSVIVTIDNTPPGRPVLLTAVRTDANVALTWQKNNETDLAGYLLYRNEQLANVAGIVIGDLKPYLMAGLSYTNFSLPDGKYTYYLLAMDKAGNTSEQSNSMDVEIDTHRPHTVIVNPEYGAWFEGKTMIRAESPDLDIVSVRFQYRKAQGGAWTDIGLPVAKAPYVIYLDPKALGLDYGNYELMATAADKVGPDLAPAPITVTYTDLTAPAAPAGLKARTIGKDVTLTWTGNGETDLDGYSVYRTVDGYRERLTASLIKGAVTYSDQNLTDADYIYDITATDTYGNESKPSDTVPARVYAPVVSQPYTPVGQNTLKIEGTNAGVNTSVEISLDNSSGKSSVGSITANAQGVFVLEGTNLAFGENRITAKAIDGNGNTSRESETVVVVYNDKPSAPVNLSANVQDHTVNVLWDTANSDAQVIGYNIFRDGAKLNQPGPAAGGTATASSSAWNWSSWPYRQYSPSLALDGALSTGWRSEQQSDEDYWWEADLPSPVLVRHLEIHWGTEIDGDDNETIYGGKDFEIQAWSGYAWIPLAKVTGNDKKDNNFNLNPSYGTDKVRIYITAAMSDHIRIAEVAIDKDNLDPFNSYDDEDLKDKKYTYHVIAVDKYGFESAPSEGKTAEVGDVTPPAAPQNLSATVVNSDVTLDWSLTPNMETDLAGYTVYRNSGDGWKKLNSIPLNVTSYLDAKRPNGTHVYRITATDTIGNESEPSKEASVEIAVAPLQPPSNITVQALPEGKTLKLAWTPPVSEAQGYNIYRCASPGGPYQRIKTTSGIASGLTDGGLENGKIYCYVVTAGDAAGNESVYSNEACGIPADSVAPGRPVITVPTVAGIPVAVDTEKVRVTGKADSNVTVDLYRNGKIVGTKTTPAANGYAFDQYPLDVPVYWASISPDGNRLAYVDDDDYFIWIKDLVSGTITKIVQEEGDTLSWSPDGSKIAYTFWDNSNNDYRIGIFDVNTGTKTNLTDDQGVYEDGPTWFPDSARLAYASTKGGDTAIWLKDVRSGETRPLIYGSQIGSPMVSRDGTKISYYDSGYYKYYNLGDDSSFTIADNVLLGYLDWAQDGKRIVYSSHNPEWTSFSLNVFNTETKEISSLIESGNVIRNPGWSYSSDTVFCAIWDQEKRKYSISEVDMQGVATTYRDGDGISYLAAIPNGFAYVDGQTLYVGLPTVSFTFQDVALAPGENSLHVIARDDAGNTSPPSEGISVTYRLESIPDLAITGEDILVYPINPKPGEEVLAQAVVKNVSNNDVDNVTVEFHLWDSTGSLNLLKSEVIPHLAANSEATVATRLTAGTQAGANTVIVVVDPFDTIKELLETNNYATADFFISDKEELTMTVTLASPQYAGAQDVPVVVSLRNTGTAVDGSLEIAVEDQSGNRVALLDGITLTLPYGANRSLSYRWNTGATFAGNYQVHSTLKGAAGILAENRTPFIITPDINIEAKILTDKASYGPNETATVSVNVRNNGRNYIIPRLVARMRICDPSGKEVFADSREILNLIPAAETGVKAGWNTGLAAPGNYLATVDLYLGDSLAVSRTAVFTIKTVTSVTGSMTVKPAVVAIGNGFKAAFTVADNGNSDTSGTLRATLIDPDSQLVLVSLEQAVSLAMNTSMSGEFTFTGEGLSLKAYLITIQYVSGEYIKTVSSASVTVSDITPPVVTVVSPTTGTTYNSTITIAALASDDASGVDKVEYQLDNGAWKLLPIADPAVGKYAATWEPVLSDNGPHTISFRATDRARNTSNPISASFTIQNDNLPPVLTVSTLSDGSFTNNATLNIAGTATDNAGVQGVAINGTAVQVNADGSFSYALTLLSGANTITTIATDLAGNQSTDTRTIILDLTAPTLVVVSPADNVKTNAAPLTVIGNVDETSRVTVILGTNTVNAVMTGNTFSADLTLVSGYNTIVFTATDLAGNQSSQKRTVLYDDQKPSVAITDPNQDIRTNKGSLTIKGTASDPLTAVTVTLTMDGQTYTPEVTNGTFEQTVSFTAEKSYAVVVTATNEVGTSSSAQRNIIYDITPPALTIGPVTSPTNQSNQVVTGTMEAGASVEVACDTATIDEVTYTSDTTWSASVTAFTAGANDIAVTATDAAGNITTATTRIIYDITPPTGSIIINSGAMITNSSQVQLLLSATDDNGVSQMRFSNDGETWTDPEAYSSTKPWLLTTGDGTKQAYVKFMDNAGNWSQAFNAGIILDTTPPTVSAAPAGGIYNSVQSVVLTASEPAIINYTTDGTVPVADWPVYSHAISIAANTTLQFIARDQAGNKSQEKTETYTIDMIPPVLTVSTLRDGSFTNQEILNISGTATDDNSGIKDVQINGVSVPVNSEGHFSYAMQLQSGPNKIIVTATDLAGNQSTDTRTINLDLSAPVLVVTAPADNSKTGTALTDVKGTVDDVNAIVTVRLGDSTQTAILTGNDFIATVLLAPKDNTIEITATDLATNTSSQKRTVFYDDQKPSLAITDPNQDIRTNKSTLTLRGTASDPYDLAVTVSITMDGQTYTPALVNGQFEQVVTFTTQKSYAIVVTATNEVKASTSAQRNVIYDITPPSLTINPVSSPASQPNQVVSGTMESGASVTVTCPTATVGTVTYPSATTWSVNITNLKQGDNAVTVTATDLSNNTTTASADIIYTITQPESTFDFAVFGNLGITMTGGSYTDSYISTPPNITRGKYKHGDIGTNSLKPCAINISGGTLIFGKAWVGYGGNAATGICVTGGSSIYNNITGSLTAAKDMTPKTDPGGGTSMGALSLSNGVTKTLSAGNYLYSSLNLTGGSTLYLIGPITIHINGNMTISNGSKMVVNSGSVLVYMNGQKIDITGGSLVNSTQDPKNLTIYGTAGLKSVNLSGGTNQHILLYAPTAAITLSGGQNTYGSLIGSTINISNGSSVHYDEVLSH